MWDWKEWDEKNTARIEELREKRKEKEKDYAYQQQRLNNEKVAIIDDSLEKEELIRVILKKYYDRKELSEDDLQLIGLYIKHENNSDFRTKMINAPEGFELGERGIMQHIYDRHKSFFENEETKQMR